MVLGERAYGVYSLDELSGGGWIEWKGGDPLDCRRGVAVLCRGWFEWSGGEPPNCCRGVAAPCRDWFE